MRLGYYGRHEVGRYLDCTVEPWQVQVIEPALVTGESTKVSGFGVTIAVFAWLPNLAVIRPSATVTLSTYLPLIDPASARPAELFTGGNLPVLL